MTIVDTGFDVEELGNRGTWTIYIGTWTALRGLPLAAHPTAAAGSYAAVMAGAGAPNDPIWGAAFATSDDILRAFAVLHALRKLPYGMTLHVRCKGLVQMLKDARQAADRGGYKADLKRPFDGYEVYKDILDVPEGKLTFEPLERRHEGKPFYRAVAVAQELPKETALAYEPMHPHLEPNTLVADSDDPDPQQMLIRRGR